MAKQPKSPTEDSVIAKVGPSNSTEETELQFDEGGDEDDTAEGTEGGEADGGDGNVKATGGEDTDDDNGHDLESVAVDDPLSRAEFGGDRSFLEREIYITIARDGLNLRSGPGVEFPIVQSIPFDTPVYLLKREGRWGLIDTRGDRAADGFAHLSFLREGAPGSIPSGLSLNDDEVRRFWTKRNPRGARLYAGDGSALVDPQLLNASAAGILAWEAQNTDHFVEIYGPGGGFRTSGSTVNHGAQPGTGRGAALDFVLIDRSTKRMLTNHPGRNHQRQGTVGQNAPLYQTLFNEVVRAGSKRYRDFISKARFGGYFATGSNALDTMHIDMRGQKAVTSGGSTTGGFKPALMARFKIPSNHPYRE